MFWSMMYGNITCLVSSHWNEINHGIPCTGVSDGHPSWEMTSKDR